MVTSVIKMLELLEFGQMTTSTIWFEWHDKNFVGDVMDKNYDAITFNLRA